MEGTASLYSVGEYGRYFSEGVDETNLDYNPNIISRERCIRRSKNYRTKEGGHGFEGGKRKVNVIRTGRNFRSSIPYKSGNDWWGYFTPKKRVLYMEAKWELENAIREDGNLPEISPKITNSFNY